MDDAGLQGNFLDQVKAVSSKPYLDSSVFFAHIKKEPIPTPGGRPRWELTQQIFTDAESGKYKIYTSTATIAEVRRIKLKTEQLTPDELIQISAFFEHEYILPVEVSREVGEKAQYYGAAYSIDVIDAIHLATAIDEQCDVLFVWDKAFTTKVPNIVENVTICEPYWEGIVLMGQTDEEPQDLTEGAT